MNTLILYASKYGTTGKAAEMLSDKISGEVDRINLKKKSLRSLEGYGRVIIGTSVYAGKVHKEIVGFVAAHEAELKEKEIAFFACCASGEKYEDYLKENFPKELLDKALFIRYFGHEEILDQMGFLDRTIFKSVAKIKTDIHDIREDAILEASEILNGAGR